MPTRLASHPFHCSQNAMPTALIRTVLSLILSALWLVTAGRVDAAPREKPAAATPPPALLALPDAIEKAAADLLRQLPAEGPRLAIVVDPLIDGVTGQRSRATRVLDALVAETLLKRHPRLDVLAFTPENAARADVVFIGTFNTINNAGQPTEPRDAYWICFALVETATRKVIARSASRAKPDGIDAAPIVAASTSPVWALDAATTAYIRNCQKAKAGDAADAAQIDGLAASAALADAETIAETGDAEKALAAYQRAYGLPGGPRVRILNGIYVFASRLGRKELAAESFASLVETGLAARRLGVMFLFEPGSTHFVRDPSVAGDYAMWLDRIGAKAATEKACLEVVGHASRTGDEMQNRRLSARRAKAIAGQLVRQRAALRTALHASGVGSREVLVGLAVDDARTAVDRRVEFRPVACRGTRQ